jgi:integrase/recombinase XerD
MFSSAPLNRIAYELQAHGKAVCSEAPSHKGALHDIPSTTRDRGHAGEESLIAYPSQVQQVALFARHFNKSPEILGPEEIRSYQVHLTNEKKLAPSSILIAVAALRFLYKVTLHKDWRLEEIIPAPKKPQKLPIVLSPEEVLQFLGCVRSVKHRTILTICYAAGLRISEAVGLKVTDIDSQRMIIRVERGKGQKCC